jgi:hypothetical protein
LTVEGGAPGNPTRDAVAVLALAAGVRVLAWLEWRSHPDSLVAVLDPAWHAAWGARIAAGDWLGGTETWAVAPGSAYLHALGALLGAGGVGGAAAMQLVIGLIAVEGVRRLGGTLAGAAGGRVAGVAAALSPVWITHDLARLGVSPAAAGLAWAFAWALGSRARACFAAGAVLALAAWFRPNLLLLAPVLVLAAGWAHDGPEPAEPRWRRAGAVALGVALVLGVSLARNLAVGGEPVLLSANAGANLAMAQAPSADGRDANFPHGGVVAGNLDTLLARSRSEAAAGLGGAPADVTPAQADAWWAARARAQVAADPARAFVRALRRFALALGTIDVQDHHPYHAHRRDRVLLGSLPDLAFLLPGLALLGVGALRARSAASLALAWLLGAASLAPFVVVERYRAPLLAVVLPLAAAGALALVGWVRARKWRPALLAAGGVVAVGALAGVDPFPGEDGRHRWVLPAPLAAVAGDIAVSPLEAEGPAREAAEAGNLAAQLARAGDTPSAVAQWRRALAVSPRAEDAQALAAALLQLGDTDAAVAVIEEEVARRPLDVASAALRCGVLLRADGRDVQAAHACEAARALAPGRWEGWYQAGVAAWRVRRLDVAEQRLVTALEVLAGRDPPAAAQAGALLAEVRAARAAADAAPR